MQVRDPLWFYLEDAFAEVDELCLNARAAELVAQEVDVSASALPSGGATTSWHPHPREQVLENRAFERARDPSFRKGHGKGANLVALRHALRSRLGDLRDRLRASLSPNDAEATFRPFVIYCDERVNLATHGALGRWEPLQSELLHIENGGEVFYVDLNTCLTQERTHPIVFEVFYFCLLDGFTGMHAEGSDRIKRYKGRLQDRLARPEIRLPLENLERPGPVLVPFPWQAYGVAGVAIVILYLVLRALGWHLSPPVPGEHLSTSADHSTPVA